MGIKSAIGDLRDLQRSVVDLFDDDRSAEAHASLQIARSAQVFSKNTKEVVDDKLSFSATLMRAGEVDAANRLLAEVEHEVREEEAALIETVNEVKVAQSMRRTRVTRLRLARMLAVATLGSALLTFSAAGMAVAGFLRDRAAEVSRPQDRVAERGGAARTAKVASVRERERRPMRRLRIGDVDLMLTASQFQTLKQLTGGADLDTDGLRSLLDVLPGALADRINQAITVAEGQVASTKNTAATVVAATPEKPSIRKKRAAKKAAEAREKAASNEQEPTPEPTPSDNNNKEDGDGSSEGEGGDTEQETEEEEGDGGLPLPGQP